MIVERVFDIDLISYVVNSSLNELLQDGQTEKDCFFDVENDCYLSVVDGDLLGVYQLVPHSLSVIDLHPIMLPVHRSKSSKTIKAVFEWILNNCSEKINKVIAQFPSSRKHIELFAIKNGFKKEGVNRGSFLKGGEYLDQTMIGITRQEMKEAIS